MIQDELARLSPGKFLDVGDVGDGIDLENRIAALAGAQAAETFREVRGRGANVRRRVEELALLPERDIEEQVRDLRGTDAETAAAVRRGTAQMLVKREDDPVGFFTPLIERTLGPVKRVPGFADDDTDPARLAVGLCLQAEASIAQPRVLAKAEAGEIAAGLAKLKPSEQAEQIRTRENRFGDAFPVARAELSQNGGAMIGASMRVASTSEAGASAATRSATPAGEDSDQLAQAKSPTSPGQNVPANTQSPVPNPKIRDDPKGDGHFGTSRKDPKAPKGFRPHMGVDLEAPPGTTVQSPVDGTVIHIGEPYKPKHPLHGQYNTIWVRDKNGVIIKMFYVAPAVGINARVKAGDPIGTMQDRARATPGMTNHVHVEVWPQPGSKIKQADPAPWLKVWGVK